MKLIVKFIGLLGLVGAVYACGQSKAEKSTAKNASTSEETFAVTKVVKDTLGYQLTLPGELKPYEQVTLYGKIDGFVTDLKVDRGDHVKKGQHLMTIEAPEIQQKLMAARARQREALEKLQYSRQNYERTKSANTVDGVVSASELQQARTRYMADSATLNSVKAEVAAAAQLAKYTEITAPFDGVITRRFVSPGALVGGGKKALLRIYREDKLRLEVAIPSKHAKALPAKTKAQFEVNSFPGRKFSVQLSRSSQALDPELRSMMIEFDYDNADGLLNGGDYAQVDMHFKRSHPTVQVPSSSIITSKSSVEVAKVNDGKVVITPVTTGLTKDGRIEVYGDLNAGDQVVVKGSSALKNGMNIKTVQSNNK